MSLAALVVIAAQGPRLGGQRSIDASENGVVLRAGTWAERPDLIGG